MGDTKEKHFRLGLKIARIVTAALAGILCAVAFSTILFFQDIQIRFETGATAKTVESINIKKGEHRELPITMKPGSYFMGWSLTPDGSEPLQNTTSLTQDTTLYPIWDGAEKYIVLSVNGITYNEVNIFNTTDNGLTADDLNRDWRVLDDYAEDNTRRETCPGTNQKIDYHNCFSRFKGWQYKNAYNDKLYNRLEYEQTSGKAGKWTWYQYDEKGQEQVTVINDVNKFILPNYRTNFEAILEYRTLNICLINYEGNRYGEPIEVKIGDKFTVPTYNDETKAFSHWQINPSSYLDYFNVTDKTQRGSEQRAEQNTVLQAMPNHYYVPGETITVDPLWYYLANDIVPDLNDLRVNVEFCAQFGDWDNETELYRFNIQKYTATGLDDGQENFRGVAKRDLSDTNPVAYDYTEDPLTGERTECIVLHYSPEILSYEFYDHKGVYHKITKEELEKDTDILIGEPYTIPDSAYQQEIYFNSEWAINIIANERSSYRQVKVVFKLGDNLYELPNYEFAEKVDPDERKGLRIGDTLQLPTCEKYMKVDHIFKGWKLVGSKREYVAGETYTITDADITNNVIEFEADWYLQRLLFKFDFDGGEDWLETKPTSFFAPMQGKFNETVTIMNEEPVKFGYDFLYWTLDDGTIKYPGDSIKVIDKIQTLTAHWEPKKILVEFMVIRGSSADQWTPMYTETETTDYYTKGELKAGGYADVPSEPSSDYFDFKYWKINKDNPAEQLSGTAETYRLTTDALKKLNTEVLPNKIMKVRIYAEMTPREVNVEFNYEIGRNINGDPIDIRTNPNFIDDVKPLRQGDLFYKYYPFNAEKSQFDTDGYQFKNWTYYDEQNRQWVPINETTIIPNYDTVRISGEAPNRKIFHLEFWNYDNTRNITKPRETNGYGESIDLPNYDSDSIISAITSTVIDQVGNDWGTFVGWSFDADSRSGNPDIIFDVRYYYEANQALPKLRLSNLDDPANYLINIDAHAALISGADYKLTLHAVYAKKYSDVTYEFLADNETGTNNTDLYLPLYLNDDFTTAKLGGKTVKPTDENYIAYGNSVLDNATLDTALLYGENFIGWRIQQGSMEGVNAKIRQEFENKLWLPGEALPSIDFGFTFEAVTIEQVRTTKATYTNDDVRECTIGNKTYRILALRSVASKVTFNGSVDIVALPYISGGYTISESGITINSDREVHVIVPANNDCIITLSPRAIRCNQIKEFYVSDNLIISGSPVVGEQFAAYCVRKSIRDYRDATGSIVTKFNNSEVYDFTASYNYGILLSADRHTLLGVPCHTNLTTETLANIISASVTHIKGYALAEINSDSLSTINLAKTGDLTIEAKAIFGGNVRAVVLPARDDVDSQISPEVLSGALYNLCSVTFGADQTTTTGYAFVVKNQIVYYKEISGMQDLEEHVMYVMRDVAPDDSLTYISNNLKLPATVKKIQPYALAAIDWNYFESLSVDNSEVNLTRLQGIPNDTNERKIPFFTADDNPYLGGRIQTYYKDFIFTNGTVTRTVTFEYGQTFRIPDPQPNKNKYGLMFEKSWHQFSGWNDNTLLVSNKIYRVGISEEIIGNGHEMTFVANDKSWRAYPVRFFTYQNKARPEDFTNLVDTYGRTYTMADLLSRGNVNNIYLPALDQTIEGTNYRFIGWTTASIDVTDIAQMNWNNAAVEYRILPNKDTHTTLTYGQVYYALYEKTTPNIEYKLINYTTRKANPNYKIGGTYAVTGFENSTFNSDSLNIPFARYNNDPDSDTYGYMVPITEIGTEQNSGVFSGITGVGENSYALNEIAIGGAVNHIHDGAFMGVKSNNLIFNHSGTDIKYNNNQTTVPELLTIGEFAFSGNTAVDSIVLPNSVHKISNSAFAGCSDLTSFNFKTDASKPSLTVVGNHVFAGDSQLSNNALIRLLIEDGQTNGRYQLTSVGYGIFKGTPSENVVNPNEHCITWKNTLLYAYYRAGDSSDLVFNQANIAGEAFTDLGNGTDSLNLTINFQNSSMNIGSQAFSNLNKSVKNIYFGHRSGNSNTIDIDHDFINAENVAPDAFDNTVTHIVRVYTVRDMDWNKRFGTFALNNNYFKFDFDNVN